ncbi:glycosyl hydrolase family 88 [Pseudopedobacter saltans DSM 12145]|uniref:Glycosyl hydrolase family 88 n=1 Tax=Pseudopedobacter saltans (strain ATCC 51119 / DSM 12145 / JCM 21818 / CCUG 39354 / LMG 10337 / NBRC 100064 / NCIMB 13643) TaxID=762903 RepID=F0S6F8_PSESL|nr:glycoside hydrolase family 88 protein [Pseudopedobacter saltans]ADY54284.1 glycosyl hydrolase family 88 [Pseudopedobacter saltans DSM 12145]
MLNNRLVYYNKAGLLYYRQKPVNLLVRRVNTLFVLSCSVCLVLLLFACSSDKQFSTDENIVYCEKQVFKTLASIPLDTPNIPRNIKDDEGNWRYVNYKDWTSGFWPGTLWYLYEATKNDSLKQEAERFTSELYNLSIEPAFDHDLGFQIFNSYGHAYKLTGDEEYKEVVLRTADTLATLYNPKVGTILSWPRSVPNMEWPQHNTIIDNMINLELLFWASKNGGTKNLYDIAVRHAETTMKNHFRNDYTSYHVVVYDKDSGERIKQVTHQGYADETMWARGQSWAIYGYTMVYRETKDQRFLDFAQKVTDVYLEKLPKDLIPYWDFNAPDIPNAPKDASAAGVVASGLLELSTFVKDQNKARHYREVAEKMITSLSSAEYQSRDKNSAFITHVTGHKPNGTEVDTSINYGDYYYIEALVRLKKLQQGIGLGKNL